MMHTMLHFREEYLSCTDAGETMANYKVCGRNRDRQCDIIVCSALFRNLRFLEKAQIPKKHGTYIHSNTLLNLQAVVIMPPRGPTRALIQGIKESRIPESRTQNQPVSDP